MTPETHILQELVEAVNRPDWWSVIATFVAAFVAAWITYKLGKRQNELQEQQLKIQEHQNELQEQQVRAQEYEVRKRLYILLTNANREIDGFLEELDSLLLEPWHKAHDGALNRKKIHIDKLFNDLKDSYTDYELKLSKEIFNKDGYLNILNLMSRVLQHTIDSLEKGEAHLSQGCQSIDSVNGDMEKGYIRHICLHFKKGYMLNALHQTLESFVKLKRTVRCDDSLLESIRAKCKID